MAEIKILGSAAVLTAGIKLEDIVKLKKFKPETLELINEEKDVVYAISAGNGESFNKHGVCFNKAEHRRKCSINNNHPRRCSINKQNSIRKRQLWLFFIKA